MAATMTYLSAERVGAHWMRIDTARILKRFFFCERSLLLSMAAHLPSIAPLPIKTELPRFIWQNMLTANALRERIFELRFPNRLLEVEADTPLISLFDRAKDAPSTAAFLDVAATLLLPALRTSYEAYLQASDLIADGPTHRFLQLAVQEKAEQSEVIAQWAEELLAADPERQHVVTAWKDAFATQLETLGNVGIADALPAAVVDQLPGAQPYFTPEQPARDERFVACRFYWPDILDPSFGYGEGVSLQLRSAVSHLNEVWAVETAGLLLHAFADTLPWEWVVDAARWTYDEARHCRMGYERLLSWGFEPSELPLGTYIYESSAGHDPIYRLGMLFFFETRNISKKPKRAELFRTYGDAVSEHDMEFDWADETIHAGYGKHWLKALLKARGEDPARYETIRTGCQALVEAYVRTGTSQEQEELTSLVDTLIAKAQAR